MATEVHVKPDSTKDRSLDLSVVCVVPITRHRISDLLCSAFEGGSNYWYRIDEFHAPKVQVFHSDPTTVFPHLDYPLNEGGSLVITAHGEDGPGAQSRGEKIKGKRQWVLDLESIRKGLNTFASRYPQHWADFMAENDDAITADVFLQCCLFGELVYG